MSSTQQTQSIEFNWKYDTSAGAVPAYVYHPIKPISQKLHPIAILFHPGGFVLGSASMVPRNQIDNLVGRGFVVVVPEYRLCPQVSLHDGPIQDAKEILTWCRSSLPALIKDATGVEADASRIVSMGQSAGGLLALTTGLDPNPPLAIVDFYGCKYFSSPHWSQPLPIFAAIPSQPLSFTSQVFTGPQAIVSAPMFVDGKPNLADPRTAWYIQQIKDGTSVSAIVPDGDFDRVDATNGFTAGFPPTYFLHGKEDAFVGCELSVRAHEALEKLGVETEIVLGGEIGHAFDLYITEEDELWAKYVVPALDFLEKHV